MKSKVVTIAIGLAIALMMITYSVVDKHNIDRESRERTDTMTEYLSCYDHDRSDESIQACLRSLDDWPGE